jgi:hypothetical protein
MQAGVVEDGVGFEQIEVIAIVSFLLALSYVKAQFPSQSAHVPGVWAHTRPAESRTAHAAKRTTAFCFITPPYKFIIGGQIFSKNTRVPSVLQC